MKTSECSQGREFGASWQFQGKICLWIWSDSNNNSQDHCETLRGNSWFFSSFFLPALLPRKASVWLKYHWQEASYLSRSAPEKARAGAAGTGCSARPGAGSGGDGHLWPARSSGSQVWRQGLPTAPLWLGDSLGQQRTRCLYLPGAKISLVSTESLTTHPWKSPSNTAPPMARAAERLKQTRLCPPAQRLWVVHTCVTKLMAAQLIVRFGFPNSSFPRITWM